MSAMPAAQFAQPLITVKEVRKLMGKDGKSMSTEDIKSMISDYEALARYAVRQYLVRK